MDKALVCAAGDCGFKSRSAQLPSPLTTELSQCLLCTVRLRRAAGQSGGSGQKRACGLGKPSLAPPRGRPVVANLPRRVGPGRLTWPPFGRPGGGPGLAHWEMPLCNRARLVTRCAEQAAEEEDLFFLRPFVVLIVFLLFLRAPSPLFRDSVSSELHFLAWL